MSICLAMIAKNEAGYIADALHSVRDLVDHWVVVDTGSTDGTQDIVRHELRDVAGELYERPWVNWAHNRSEVLALARATGCDWIFILDADERVIAPPGFDWPELDADAAYRVQIEYGPVTYARPNLLSTRHNWHYVGVTHEYATALPHTPALLPLPLTLLTHPTRADKSRERCLEDAELLAAALVREPDNARYQFYYAQSLRDAGLHWQAFSAYRRRELMGGWEEEVWYSIYQCALLGERCGFSTSEVRDFLRAAYAKRPQRAEPLVRLAASYRLRGDHAMALVYARAAALTPMPDDLLFVEPDVYHWRALDEYAIASYFTGHRNEGVTATRLLLEADVPESERARIAANARFFDEVTVQ